MMRSATALALTLLLAGCSSAGEDVSFRPDPTPEADAGGDVVPMPTSTGSGGASGSAGVGNAGSGGTGGASGGSAGAVTAGSAGTGGGGTAVAPIDSGAPTADAATTMPEAGPDTASAPDAGADSGAPRIDAGGDAAVASDTTDGATADPICTAAPPKCDGPNRTDAQIRAAFTTPCSPEWLQKCGGVYSPPPDDVTETIPMLCKSGIWRLAGSWSGSQWVSYECSHGCAAGQLCDP